MRSCAALSGARMRQLPRPADRGAGQLHRHVGRQPLGLARRRQRLDQVEDIGRARAGHGGHRVHLMLALQPHHLAHGRHQRLGQGHVRVATHAHCRTMRRDPAAHHRRACSASRGRSGCRAPSTASNVAIGVPAAIETNSVVAVRPSACSAGSAVAHHLRLDRKQRDGGGVGQALVQVHARCRFSQSDGFGSITQTDAGGSPAVSQPSAAPTPSCRSPAAPARPRATVPNVMQIPR